MIKTVISPIVWRFGDASYVNKAMRATHSMTVVRTLKAFRNCFESYATLKRKNVKTEILQRVDAVLPNSVEEGEILRQQYHVDFKEVVVPNCIDINMTSQDVQIDVPDGFVLEVGRIEPTKNQLSFIEAMMPYKEVPLAFIGKQNKRKQYYIDKVKRLAKIRGNTFFIEEIPQEKLIGYYKAAKVHVLPSFRESPGLVSLEALCYGCNIVVSNSRYCPTGYYQFDEIGYLCDPYSPSSIGNAVLSALKSDPAPIKKEYFNFYSYSNAAEITRNAYLELVK